MSKDYLWLAVTPDQYELPFGLKRESVINSVQKNSSGKRSGRKFVKVRV